MKNSSSLTKKTEIRTLSYLKSDLYRSYEKQMNHDRDPRDRIDIIEAACCFPPLENICQPVNWEKMVLCTLCPWSKNNNYNIKLTKILRYCYCTYGFRGLTLICGCPCKSFSETDLGLYWKIFVTCVSFDWSSQHFQKKKKKKKAVVIFGNSH